MAIHYITKCSCGSVISQCRCPSVDKKIDIIENGCVACHNREMEPLVKGITDIAEYLGCNASELVSEVTKLIKRRDIKIRNNISALRHKVTGGCFMPNLNQTEEEKKYNNHICSYTEAVDDAVEIIKNFKE